MAFGYIVMFHVHPLDDGGISLEYIVPVSLNKRILFVTLNKKFFVCVCAVILVGRHFTDSLDQWCDFIVPASL